MAKQETLRITFSKRALDTLPPAMEGERAVWHDTATPGLVLEVTDRGTKTFYSYRWTHGKPNRVRIGRFPDLSVEVARKRAVQILADIAAGKDPTVERAQANSQANLETLWQNWQCYAKAHKRAASIKSDQQLWEAYLSVWKTRRLGTIRRVDVAGFHQKLGTENGQYLANRALALLSSMFGKASDVGFDGANPCKGVQRFREETRDRFLTPDELPKFLAAVEKEPDDSRHYHLLLLYTGQRRGAVRAMRWQDISGDVWRVPVEFSKSKKPVDVALTAPVLAILKERRGMTPIPETPDDKRHLFPAESPWVFPADSETGHRMDFYKEWRSILKTSGLTGLRPHDLRRTLGSWQAAAGVSLPIIGKTLGHSTSEATMIYSRLQLDPVRAAVELAVSAMLAAGKAKGKEGSK